MNITPPKMCCSAPTGYLGGKTKLRPTIISCIPPHECYIETCVGSGTVFFGKSPKISKNEIINDVSGELVNLMKVLSGTYFDESIRQEFIEYVRNMPAAREVYEDWKFWDKEKLSKLTPAQRAFRFYYCVKKGFSSVPKGGYEASPLSGNRYNMKSDFEQITARFRARNAQIENMDFRDLINKYSDKRAKSHFFCDPPYFVAIGTNYYEYNFTKEDHVDFRKCCDIIDGNKNTFLITYDDVPEVIELYKKFYIYRTDLIDYSAAQRKEKSELAKTELFITNYDIVKLLKEKDTRDIFEGSDAFDTNERIDFDGHIGLKRIN